MALDNFSKDEETGGVWEREAGYVDGWQKYGADKQERFNKFHKWLKSQEAQYIAVVSHFGTTQAYLSFQPCGGRSYRSGFFMNSAGRIAVHMQAPPPP